VEHLEDLGLEKDDGSFWSTMFVPYHCIDKGRLTGREDMSVLLLHFERDGSLLLEFYAGFFGISSA